MQPLRTEEVLAPKALPSKKKRKRDWTPYHFIFPSIILILLINAYPFLSGLIYSFKDGTLLKEGSFVWFDNYIRLMSMNDFWHSVYFSALFAIFSVIGSYLMGLGLALLINKEVACRGFFRVALLVPWIIPSIVSIVSWRWLIGDQNGLVNVILGWFGVKPILFLGQEGWAIFSVIVIKIWRAFPFMMISILAALQSIDRDIYEAAQIDGAGRWKTFFHITMPHLKTISIVCWILMTIYCFNDFDTIWLLTEGGPASSTESLIILAYKYTFTKNDVGLGSAIAIISLIILMTLAIFLLKKLKEQEA